MQKELDRRNFLEKSAKAVAVYILISQAFASRAWSKNIESSLVQWAKRIGEIGQSVQSGKMTPLQWQAGMDELYRHLSVNEISQFINKDRLLQSLVYPKEKIGAIADVTWPKIEGFPSELHFGHKLFVYRKGSSTPPHAHNHLVSAHFVIEGQIRVRTFNRENDLDQSLLISPARDVIVNPGELITMSDDQENVHWFEGMSDRSISFDIPIVDVTPNKKYKQMAGDYNQIFIDPMVPHRSDGKIEAPVISFQDSLKKFA